jgi:hypothetical protein
MLIIEALTELIALAVQFLQMCRHLNSNATCSWVEEMEEVNIKGLKLVSTEARFKSTNENLCRRRRRNCLVLGAWLMHSAGGEGGETSRV